LTLLNSGEYVYSFKKNVNSIDVTDWLISCRVFSRTLENYLIKLICNYAKKHDVTILRLFFIETSKNRMMRDIFKDIGFELESAENQVEIWMANVNDIDKLKSFIS